MFLMELGTQEHLVMEQLVICCLDLFTAGIWSGTVIVRDLLGLNKIYIFIQIYLSNALTKKSSIS